MGGSTCFPLSPHRKHSGDYRYHTNGTKDQLHVIFNKIGTPTEDEVAKMERDDAKRYVKCFEARPGSGLQKEFPWVKKEGVEALVAMLKFSPTERITVQKALEPPVLERYRDKSSEVSAKAYVTLTSRKSQTLQRRSCGGISSR